MGSPHPDADLVARAVELLRAAGGRITSARLAVLAALVDAPHHPNAESIGAAAKQTDPSVHLATVYRTLDALERLGVVSHVHLGHGRSTYHLSSEAHHHAVCDGCGAVIELDDAPLLALAESVRSTHGFSVDTRHFALVGRCHVCSGTADPHPG